MKPMQSTDYIIREADPTEYEALGRLMVRVYAQLPGFPQPDQQPRYYDTLANIGHFASKPGTKLLVAKSSEGHLGGGVVYFGDMQYYASGGAATQVKNGAGFRLLAVDPDTRGQGLGKRLTLACLDLANAEKQEQIIIHSTKSMQAAWAMYLKIGFERSEDLDFMQDKLPVFGFRLKLTK